MIQLAIKLIRFIKSKQSWRTGAQSNRLSIATESPVDIKARRLLENEDIYGNQATPDNWWDKQG